MSQAFASSSGDAPGQGLDDVSGVRAASVASAHAPDLSAMFDDLPLGFALLERNLCLSKVNRFLSDVLGAAPEQHVGKNVFDVFPALAESLEPVAEQLLQGGQTICERDLVVTHARTGRRLHLSASFYPARSRDGSVIGVGVTLVDVTQQRDEERFRDIFVGVLGHDLRTPIQSMILSCGVLLRQEGLPEPARGRLNTLCDSAKRMGRMIEQILDLTRIRSGNMPVSFRQTDLVAVTREVVEQLQLLTPDALIRLAAPRSLVGLWDADRLNQVLTNLLGNALRHGAAGAAVEVELCEVDGNARLTISNRGRAIPESIRSTLFTPFHRQSGARRKSLGLGLGLYITREIVLAHSGIIDVESSDERTCFTVNLPKIPPRSG